jgi:polyhydroxybutyrate depolymerase
VHVPDGFDPGTPTPLFIFLHGYGATGPLNDLLLGFGPEAKRRGLLFATPEGTRDPNDSQFWNATDACCNFFSSDVDDVAYLRSLIDEISAKVSVDPKRIYFAGHSNGAFMSNRFACDAADRVAAFFSLAGATYADPSMCEPSEPVSMIQAHGLLDDVVLYEGGNLAEYAGFDFEWIYPGAEQTVATWASLDGCTGPLEDQPGAIDLLADEIGAETTIARYAGCPAGVDVELWRHEGAGHIPSPTPPFAEKVIDFFLAHPKP